MIIVLRPHVTEEEIALVVEHVRELGLTPHVSRGVTRTIIGCIGDEDRLREVPMMSFPAVESVLAVEKPYKLAAREFAAGDTLVHLGQAAIGDGAVHVIAGPCSVEGPEMLRQTAEAVKAAGAVGLRGGAFKPRTSPYSFHGLGLDALDMLADVRAATGLPVITETLDTRHVAAVAQKVDCVQVGRAQHAELRVAQCGGIVRKARAAQARHVGDARRSAPGRRICPGARQHAGDAVRARHPHVRRRTRATPSTSTPCPYLKRETHLPVLVDPSHACGRRDLVPSLALAAVAAGADGLMIEVHPDPDHALSDGDQSMPLDAFAELMDRVRDVAQALGRGVNEVSAPLRR